VISAESKNGIARPTVYIIISVRPLAPAPSCAANDTIEALADRVLFLKGEIEMVASQAVEKINDVKQMLEYATKAEDEAVVMYNDFANQCGTNADSATKKLFESLVNDEERHYGQFDDQMENVNRFGNEYLALQTVDRGKGIATMPPGHPVISE
jgi:bacterioferritin